MLVESVVGFSRLVEGRLKGKGVVLLTAHLTGVNGTLIGVSALSGYCIDRSGHTIVFSLLELWSYLPPLMHRVLLGGFGLAL